MGYKVNRTAVGKVLARERILRGLRQKDMAVMLGIGPNVLSEIEVGTRALSAEKADKIIATFEGLTKSDIESIRDQVWSPRAVMAKTLTKEQRRLYKRFMTALPKMSAARCERLLSVWF